MITENPKILLRLAPSRLAAIIDFAVVTTSEVVNFHFNALEVASLDSPEEAAATKYRFPGPQMSAADRRVIHKNWMLAKAFQDLLRAVRLALEEAHVYVSLLTKSHKVRSSDTILEFLQPFQRRAAKLTFPELLSSVNDKLTPKLDFASSYRSLQSARNCLEHRNGIVSTKDTGGEQVFRLSVPRIKIFYMRQGAEVEIEEGHAIESGDDRSEVDVLMRLDVRERSLVVGERLIFTLAEFNEIAFACHFLGQQLSSRLPRPILSGP